MTSLNQEMPHEESWQFVTFHHNKAASQELFGILFRFLTQTVPPPLQDPPEQDRRCNGAASLGATFLGHGERSRSSARSLVTAGGHGLVESPGDGLGDLVLVLNPVMLIT